MKTKISEIIRELSYRVNDGIPNLNNEQHLIKLFDVLKEFKEDVFHQIPENLRAKLPEVPEKGDLDITLLRECDFFFA